METKKRTTKFPSQHKPRRDQRRLGLHSRPAGFLAYCDEGGGMTLATLAAYFVGVIAGLFFGLFIAGLAPYHTTVYRRMRNRLRAYRQERNIHKRNATETLRSEEHKSELQSIMRISYA